MKLLEQLARKGKPLAEVVVILNEGEDAQEVARLMNKLPEDIEANVLPAYFQFDETNIKYQLRLDATKESLQREFGWNLEREKIYDTKEHDGIYPDAYAWKEVNSPQFYPSFLEGKIR